jgi:hypothetical protein
VNDIIKKTLSMLGISVSYLQAIFKLKET